MGSFFGTETGGADFFYIISEGDQNFLTLRVPCAYNIYEQLVYVPVAMSIYIYMRLVHLKTSTLDIFTHLRMY